MAKSDVSTRRRWARCRVLTIDRGRRLPPPLIPVVSVPASVCPDKGPAPSLACEKEILLAIRDDLWITYDPGVQDLMGITVGGETPRVTSIRLPRSTLTGAVPSALSQLSHLQRLFLNRNRLTGPISPNWVSSLS